MNEADGIECARLTFGQVEEQSGGIHEGEREGRFASSEERVLEQRDQEDLLPWPSP